MRLKLLKPVFAVALYFILYSNSMFGQCGPGTPVFNVNLAGVPDSAWVSPLVQRNDTCCGVTNPDVCIKFIITLDSSAVGINFNVVSGAMPTGALFYQINCGPPTPVGQPICLNGPGPHVLTFCKPGNNQNTYGITSIPGPTVSTDIIVNDGCTGSLVADGYNAATVTWNSIFPGASGAYNNYLSCTSGCTTTQVTAQAGYPPYVDYVVCGIPAATCITSTVCDTVRVTFNPTLFVNINPAQPTVCFGQTNASLTAIPTGGTPPYNYSWSTGATTQSVTVGAGTYLVILGDASGCPPTTDTVVVTQFTNPITANAGPDIYVCATSPAAALSGTVTGVTTGQWSGGAGTFSPSNTSLNATYTPTASEISAGSINLLLTTTNNGTCPGDVDTVQIFFTTFTATITPVVTPPACNGQTTGSVALTVSGPFSPFTATWQTNPIQTGLTATNLPAGGYTYTVTNSLGCTITQTVTVTQPPGLSSVMSLTNVNCAGSSTGGASVMAIGGTPGYSYSWSPVAGSASSISNVPAGTYFVTITDANGCTLQDTAILSQPPALSVTVSGTSPSCSGQSNGTAAASVSGGTPGYIYSWVGTGSTSPFASGLSGGTYTVNVTDATGCTGQGTVTLTNPPPLVLTVSKTNETCENLNNGTATANVSGGTPTYSYLWQPGSMSSGSVSGLTAGAYTVTVTDSKGCQILTVFSITQPNPLLVSFPSSSNITCNGANNGTANASVIGGTPAYVYNWAPAPGSGQGTTSASNMSAGNYTLTVLDAQGCISSQTVTITQPAPLTASLTVNNVTCNGVPNGSINVSPAGGTAPYSNLLLPGNTNGTLFTGLSSGSYTVITTDANGCTVNGTATITQPGVIIVSSSSTNSNCGSATGSASVVLGGGIGPYNISWAPNGGTAATANNLFAGSYTVTVTDANGCVDNETVIVNDNAGPSVSIGSSTNVSCFGGSNGSATANVSGGLPPYTYLWSPVGGTNPTATGLSAGVYIVTVTDANGCQSQAITSPPITQPPALALTINSTAVSCNGGSNGTASSIVSGGTSPYSYLWSPGAVGTPTVGGLSAQTYSLTVTDNNGCQIVGTVNITQPNALTASIASTSSVSCFGGNNGSASVTASSGTPPYSYNWSPSGGATPVASGLSAGSYTCIVTDSKGCTFTVSTTISQPASPLFATITNNPVSCFGGSDGTATANPSGGTAGYSYSWSPSGAATQTATGLSQGSHFVTVTDANGCSYTATTIVYQPTAISLSVTTINSTCGNSNGLAYASVSGGSPAYSYLWSPSGGTNSSATLLAAGNYTLNVTDSKNCIATFPFTLSNTDGPTVTASAISNVSCFGGATGMANATVSNGTAPFQFAWSPSGASTQNAGSLMAGIHQVIVYDLNGCSDTATVTITQPSQLVAGVTTATNVSCFGGNNGSLSSSVSGGTGPYNYSWSPSGGIGPVASNLFMGSYTVTITDANSCIVQATGAVTQPPQLSTTISASANPSCFGYQNGWMTTNAFGGTAPYSYSWSTSPVQSTQSATGLGTGSYTVTVTDANGCNTTASATLTQPSQILSVGGNSQVICAGSNATLSASASGGSGAFTYYWNPGAFTGNNVSVSPSATTTYSVTAYDANGCPGTTDTLTVTVYTLNPGNLVVTAYSPICPGTSTVVYAQVNGTPGPLTYTWNNGLPPGPGGYTVTPIVPTTYICTVTNSCGVSVTESVTITFNPPPSVSIIGNVTGGCVPLTVQFLDQSVGLSNDPINSWLWNFGNGVTSSVQNPQYTFTTPGVYNVTLNVQTIGGCTNSNTSAPYQVSVYSIPVAAFNINSSVLDLPYDPLVTTNLSVGATQYVWTFGDGGSTTATNATHIYTAPGVYTVSLVATNQFGCKDSTTKTVETRSDIVFPNAFTPDATSANGGAYSYEDYSNNVFYPFTAGIETYRLLIFNRWGELVFESTDVKKGWDGYYKGELCQQDVYIWKAEVKFIGGRSFSKIGDVTLIR